LPGLAVNRVAKKFLEANNWLKSKELTAIDQLADSKFKDSQPQARG
jgi:hypothetical protein